MAFIAFMLVMLFISLVSCERNNTMTVNTEPLDRAKEAERNRLRQELVLFQNELKRENRKIEDRIGAAGEFDRERLNLIDRKLKGHQAKIEKAITDLNSARNETWDNVRDLSSATLRELRASYERISLDRSDSGQGGF